MLFSKRITRALFREPALHEGGNFQAPLPGGKLANFFPRILANMEILKKVLPPCDVFKKRGRYSRNTGWWGGWNVGRLEGGMLEVWEDGGCGGRKSAGGP